MTRPMPTPARRALIQTYHGRRRRLAEAAHAYIKFYEDHEGYDIDWTRDTVRDAARVAEDPSPTLTVRPQCLCEEEFLRDVLWTMISNTPGPPAGAEPRAAPPDDRSSFQGHIDAQIALQERLEAQLAQLGRRGEEPSPLLAEP